MEAHAISKPMKHLMEWSFVLAIGMCAANLVIVYSSHTRSPGTAIDIVWLAFLTALEIGSIQNARDAMVRDRRCLVPICVAGTFLLALILFFADIYRDCGLISANSSVSSPGSFIYFSFVTWTTTGYGDIVPSRASRPFAAAEMVYGYVFMAVYIAMIGYAMFNSSLARALKESSSATRAGDSPGE